jgi:Na+-transporting methylmalonyl-CoA/oxaloacetate decarboxylase beta subunit
MKLINNYLGTSIIKEMDQQRRMLQRLNMEQKTSSQLLQQHMPKRNVSDLLGNAISSSLIISYMRR